MTDVWQCALDSLSLHSIVHPSIITTRAAAVFVKYVGRNTSGGFFILFYHVLASFDVHPC